MHVPAMKRLCRTIAVGGAASIAWLMTGPAAAGTDDGDQWQQLRSSLFGSRPLAGGANALALTVPRRADDASVVPVAIRAGNEPLHGVPRKLYLIIDRNPSPLAGVFEFGEGLDRAEIETRVRVEDNSVVRAVAEYADGSLAMTTKFIKASGGCSAPANRRESDAATLGQMRWQLPEDADPDETGSATLFIRHPNTSGLAMDQMSRLYDPPHFVRHVKVTYEGRLVLSADVDFSISENPAFRFAFKPGASGELRAEVSDSNALEFESRVSVRAGGR